MPVSCPHFSAFLKSVPLNISSSKNGASTDIASTLVTPPRAVPLEVKSTTLRLVPEAFCTYEKINVLI